MIAYKIEKIEQDANYVNGIEMMDIQKIEVESKKMNLQLDIDSIFRVIQALFNQRE